MKLYLRDRKDTKRALVLLYGFYGFVFLYFGAHFINYLLN